MSRPKSTPIPRLTPERTEYSYTFTGRHLLPGPLSGHVSTSRRTSSEHQQTSRCYVSADWLITQWRLQGYQWAVCSNGQMPSRPVQSGTSRFGEPLYIARALSPGMMQCLGTFIPSSQKCYIMWKGCVTSVSEYEILCQKPKLQNSTTPVNSTVETSLSYLSQSLKVMTLRSPLKLSNFEKMGFKTSDLQRRTFERNIRTK